MPTALAQTPLVVGGQHVSHRHIQSTSLSEVSTFLFSYLLAFVCSSRVHSHDTYVIIHGHVWNTRKGVTHVFTFPSQWNQGMPCLLAFTLALQTGALFLLHLCAFCWQLHCLKWAPSITPKDCLMFREQDAPDRENMSVCLIQLVLQALLKVNNVY